MSGHYKLIKDCRCPGTGISSTRKCTAACFSPDTRAQIDAASRSWTSRIAIAGPWRGGSVPFQIRCENLGPNGVNAISDWVDGPDRDPLYAHIAPGHRGDSIGDGRKWKQEYRFEEDRILIRQVYPGVTEERFEVRLEERPKAWPWRPSKR
jgi:hypothetical protein